jgi:hypothetical protein
MSVPRPVLQCSSNFCHSLFVRNFLVLYDLYYFLDLSPNKWLLLLPCWSEFQLPLQVVLADLCPGLCPFWMVLHCFSVAFIPFHQTLISAKVSFRLGSILVWLAISASGHSIICSVYRVMPYNDSLSSVQSFTQSDPF